MDVRVFHQNMKNFSPGDSKLDAFRTRFREIGQRAGKHYAVAGLTELCGEPKSLADMVPKLTANLDNRLDRAVIVAIGQLSSPRRVEYIGIAYDSSFFTLEAAGCVLRQASSNDWICSNRPAASITRGGNSKRLSRGGYILMPSTSLGYKLDYRGVAYVSGLINNVNKYIFCFMHNDYANGDRSGSFRGLGFVAEKILDATGNDPDTTSIIVGGDFNVQPDDVAGREVSLTARYVEGDNGKPLNTTNANPYDFWLLSDSIDVLSASVHTETRNFLMSDHAGISIEFGY